ncbi:hypothetical protein CDCA_CDCA09G2576 [Cyanidium caldarium]|uniref:Mitochondrial outer membrane transport complex Sam37/metaxin N-terminal domain-containing protein n=1 Tax=Cyanidium caldarium TaxID=2771 RepID=A0AAV9IWQ8_CYACA|nr:hypothetical protein CDCA_CDCA09G2576 [Cyanidium caldarium]
MAPHWDGYHFTLYQDHHAAWGLPSNDPDCLAAHALLRFLGVPSAQLDVRYGSLCMTDKLALPVVLVERRDADAENAAGMANQCSVLSAGLLAVRERWRREGWLMGDFVAADADAYTCLVRDRLDLARLYEWWHLDTNYQRFTHRHYAEGCGLPLLARLTVPRQERESVRARLAQQSAAFREVLRRGEAGKLADGDAHTSATATAAAAQHRHAPLSPTLLRGARSHAGLPVDDHEFWNTEVEPLLDALVARLGRGPYFGGGGGGGGGVATPASHAATPASWQQRPGYLDAVVYGHLAVYLAQDLPTASILKELVAKRPKLVRFVERIRSEYFTAPVTSNGETTAATSSSTDRAAVTPDTHKPRASAGPRTSRDAPDDESIRKSSKKLTPEEEAQRARESANRAFILLTVGSFVFYTLFGSAIDVRIGS